jgi:hypothetical protein
MFGGLNAINKEERALKLMKILHFLTSEMVNKDQRVIIQ